MIQFIFDILLDYFIIYLFIIILLFFYLLFFILRNNKTFNLQKINTNENNKEDGFQWNYHLLEKYYLKEFRYPIRYPTEEESQYLLDRQIAAGLAMGNPDPVHNHND